MHLTMLLFSYYHQLLSLAKSLLHESGNVEQAVKESPHKNGAVSIWKDRLKHKCTTASHICSCPPFTTCRNNVECFPFPFMDLKARLVPLPFERYFWQGARHATEGGNS